MNQQFQAGVKASISVCLGVIPVGISVGLLATQMGMSRLEAILMSAMVMAGSSELMAINMIGQEAALPTILIAAFLINLRHLVMSSSVMQRMKGTTLSQRLTGAFALCDESFALYSLSSDGSYSFLLGSNSALYASFVGSTIVGCLVTSVLPQIVIDSFGIAFYAAFLGMLLPVIRRHARLMFLVLITAGSNWLLQLFLPASWSVIIAMILGALIGVWIVDDGTLRETRGEAV